MNKHHTLPDKYDFYLKLMETTLKNANQFRKDALLLRSNLSFGHAYSLAILGFEELAKSWFAFGLFIGTHLETGELVSRITSDHQVKQEIGWQTLASFILSDLSILFLSSLTMACANRVLPITYHVCIIFYKAYFS